MGEIDLKGWVGVGIYPVSQNISLAIQSHAMVNAAVFVVFRVVSGF